MSVVVYIIRLTDLQPIDSLFAGLATNFSKES